MLLYFSIFIFNIHMLVKFDPVNFIFNSTRIIFYIQCDFIYYLNIYKLQQQYLLYYNNIQFNILTLRLYKQQMSKTYYTCIFSYIQLYKKKIFTLTLFNFTFFFHSNFLFISMKLNSNVHIHTYCECIVLLLWQLGYKKYQ